ncbi:MAG: hypothetical protein K0Q48_3097 [Bacillota bacterium]|jgi:hypothetical protein|nr:hypothetical protein [Bacillota bacterium]
MIKIAITGKNGTMDISQLVPSISLSGEFQQCARTLEFSMVASATDTNLPVVSCELGNKVTVVFDGLELFNGIVFSKHKSTSGSSINVTCFDYGIYLKRNEAVYKFPNWTPEAITKRICADFGITPGRIATTGVKISRNFIGVDLYSMIQTAYTIASAKTGKKYQIRFRGLELDVIEKGMANDPLILSGGRNLISASTTESIENMINQVRIYNSKDQLIDTKENSEAVKLYGRLQSYLRKADHEDAAKEAEKILTDYDVSQKISVENLGSPLNITGNAVIVQEPYTGLYGLFYIDNDVHTWTNGQYYNKLVLNFENMMDEKDLGKLG